MDIIFQVASVSVFIGVFIGVGLGITYGCIAVVRGLYGIIVRWYGRWRNRRQGDRHFR